MLRRRVGSALMATALLVAAAACGHDEMTAEGTQVVTGEVTVLAATSLTGAFTEVAAAFEEAHDGVDVRLSFDGSSALATQILEGAPADVFASADEANLAKVRDAGLAEPPVRFATNEVVIVVPAGNPDGVRSLEDLLGDRLRIALCAPEVPCGRYAATAFERAGLAVPPASRETNVRGVLTNVGLGEADAGIVYVTDVASDASVEGIALPADVEVTVAYPAAVLVDAGNPRAAATFVAFLAGDEAQAILRRAGFGPP